MSNAIYYPSCLVNLRLRFDEGFRIVALPEAWPQGGDPSAVSIPQQASPTDENRRKPRSSFGAFTRDPETGALVNTPNPTYAANTRPLFTQSGKDNLSAIMNRIPKSANIQMPSYRQAGKFTLEFDWRELPIDPRLVRSAAVEIFLGTVTAANFARGMAGVDADGQRLSILRNLPDEAMVLTGIADSWSTSHSESGSTVKMEGRDLRGMFLDSPMDPDFLTKLDLTQPVNKVVKSILERHPGGQLMQVICHVQDWPNQTIPSCADKDGLTRVRRQANGQGTTSDSPNDDVSIWDMITIYCQLVGAVPFFRGRNLVIRPVRSIFDPSKPWFDPNDETFRPRTRVDDDGQPFTERKMVFGRNVKELTFDRKLSGVKVPVVEVASMDTSSKERGGGKLLVEQWPPSDEKMARIAGVSPSGEVAQTDKLKIYKPGIRDRNQLLGIARSIWEEVGRGEMGGNCVTTALASFKGDNTDPDIFRLRPGDQVEFAVDTRELSSKAPNQSTYTDSHRRPFDLEVAEVKKRLASNNGGGDENIARVIVASARSLVYDLLAKFRVSNVTFDWNIASGVSASFDFQSYFTPRYGINEQLGRNVVEVESETARSSKTFQPKAVVQPSPKVKSDPRTPIRTGGGSASSEGRVPIRTGGGSGT